MDETIHNIHANSIGPFIEMYHDMYLANPCAEVVIEGETILAKDLALDGLRLLANNIPQSQFKEFVRSKPGLSGLLETN